ncbi:MAG: tRNA (guanosine(37)-N1)-methyltransferase TrmD [Burkholderiales bacterium]|nr:tRNA (guanosine(37)-N1)-methyltransferase TrmD [Burkholderiales bacterium]
MAVRFDAVTLFPAMFEAVTRQGVSGRAAESGLWSLACWNPRDFAGDPYRTVDDRPYGGGPGMVMIPGPLEAALAAARAAQAAAGRRARVLYLTPQGRRLDHAGVVALAAALQDGIGAVLLCGRYEGIDERVIARHVDEEWSIGDYVLSGGELAAMVVIDAVVRQLPGVLGHDASAAEESFADGLLDCPHYTRPEEHAGMRVPEVLLSGDHAKIARWRRKQAAARTLARRPDLFGAWSAGRLTKDEARIRAEVLAEAAQAGQEEQGSTTGRAAP